MYHNHKIRDWTKMRHFPAGQLIILRRFEFAYDNT